MIEKLVAVEPPAADPFDLASVQRDAEECIDAIAASLNTGDELFNCAVCSIGYGRSDVRLRCFLRAVQKHLERAGG